MRPPCAIVDPGLIPTTWGVRVNFIYARAELRLIPTTWGVPIGAGESRPELRLIPTTWGVL